MSAFVLIKDNKAYWWSLGDSGVVLFDKEGAELFQSPAAWPDEKDKIAAVSIADIESAGALASGGSRDGAVGLSDTEFNKMKKKLFRNILSNRSADGENNRFGYGVITGEPNAAAYLNVGTLDLTEGDRMFLYTDGYEDYVKVPEFISHFSRLPSGEYSSGLEHQLEEYMSKKNDEDIKYGRERSLIVVGC